MNHIQANCSSCNKELKIRVAKGDNAPERVMCKACSQNISAGPIRMKLADALKIAKGSKRVMRCGHRDENFVRTHKQAMTPRQAGQIKRIYGS